MASFGQRPRQADHLDLDTDNRGGKQDSLTHRMDCWFDDVEPLAGGGDRIIDGKYRMYEVLWWALD